MKRVSDLFDDQWSPLKVQFWHQPAHMDALNEGMSADEAEALRAEWQMIRAGSRDVLGRPCLCGKIEQWPAAVHGGSNRHGDSMASIYGLRADLDRAVDALPIAWLATQEMFKIQGRESVWRIRINAHRIMPRRLSDTMPDLGYPHAYAWAAWTLGWRGVQKWPKREPAQLRPRVQEAA